MSNRHAPGEPAAGRCAVCGGRRVVVRTDGPDACADPDRPGPDPVRVEHVRCRGACRGGGHVAVLPSGERVRVGPVFEPGVGRER